MRKLMIAANFKLHKTDEEVAEFLQALKAASLKEREVLVCPSYLSVIAAHDIVKDSEIMIGAQDISRYKQGAYTGDVSGLMLKGFCDYALLGHSERRHIFKDTDEIVREKLKMALDNGIKPLLCIGETAQERKEKQTEEVLKRQLEYGLSYAREGGFIIAYEPVWAISSGDKGHEPATPELAQQQHVFIRDQIERLYGKEVSENVRILYGGSVKPENVASFIEKQDIDGVLVGSASLDVNSFIRIVNA